MGGGWGVAEKSTGRVTNGSQPGCQLTVAVLHGGLVNENDRERGEKERKRAGSLQVPKNLAKVGILEDTGKEIVVREKKVIYVIVLQRVKLQDLPTQSLLFKSNYSFINLKLSMTDGFYLLGGLLVEFCNTAAKDTRVLLLTTLFFTRYSSFC